MFPVLVVHDCNVHVHVQVQVHVHVCWLTSLSGVCDVECPPSGLASLAPSSA